MNVLLAYALHVQCMRNLDKRSMDLGALLDTCNWCDIHVWQFSTDLFHSNIWPTKPLYKIYDFEM